MRHRPLALVVVAWAVSRVALAWLTANDDVGPYRDQVSAAHDIVLYDYWAAQIGAGHRPYEAFALEYPPANLPFLVLPAPVAITGGWSYESAFIAMAVAVDGVALAGLVRMARRGGSWWGAAAWVAVVPLLGPVALSRLDVIPAAALVWAVVLAREGRWGRSGAALGVAVGTKVFAGLLAPLWWFVSRDRSRTAAGAVVAVVVPVALVADLPDALVRNLWDYHSARGTVAESLWGSLLLTAEHLGGRTARIELQHGAWEILHPRSEVLKAVATLAVLGVVLDAVLTAWRRIPRGDVDRLAVLASSTVVLSVALGNVFSPQYVLWAAGAVAVAAATGTVDLRAPLALLAVVAALSHLVFPVLFADLLFEQQVLPLVVLLVRNAAMLALGVLLLRAVDRRPPGSDPAVEEDEALPVGA